MTNTTWIDIGHLDDLPPRSARTVRWAGRDIAVFRTADDDVFALENRCPHRGGPLADGIVHGRKVACPLHNWVIDLESGGATGADEGCAESFAVRLEGGRMLLALPAIALAAE